MEIASCTTRLMSKCNVLYKTNLLLKISTVNLKMYNIFTYNIFTVTIIQIFLQKG